MLKNIIRYLGLALVIVGIVLVMKNLFSNDTNDWNTKKSNTKIYYEANIKLLDEETKEYIIGSDMVLKDSKGEVVDKWTTEKKSHTIIKLEKGTYTLEQIKTIDGYNLNKDTITFKILKDNKNIVMYNKSIAEEPKETANEISVDNTLSTKNIIFTLISGLILLSGIIIISITSKRVSN